MSAIEATIVERLHQLDERRMAQVLDFVEFLAAKSARAPSAADLPQIDPPSDLARFDPMRYSGTVQWPVDGLAYQEAVRKEWE